jgi:hypothetical protein
MAGLDEGVEPDFGEIMKEESEKINQIISDSIKKS